MKKLLIYLFLTAFCCAGAYADGGTTGGDGPIDPLPPPGPPTQPYVSPFKSLKNTAPQITYTKGYISVCTANYQNIIVRVQGADGTVLYQNAMTENLLIIDTRSFSPGYTLVILNK